MNKERILGIINNLLLEMKAKYRLILSGIGGTIFIFGVVKLYGTIITDWYWGLEIYQNLIISIMIIFISFVFMYFATKEE